MGEPITGPVLEGAGPSPDTGWARAERSAPFLIIVFAELRKLTDTVVGRVLLLAAPPTILLLNMAMFTVSQDATVSSQIGGVVVAIELGQFFAHAALIRSITSEWLYGGVKGTVLVQPSRMRYVLSQVSVSGVLWLGCAVLQILLAILLGPMAAARSGVPYLLGDRWGWVVAVCLLGSLLGMLAALTVSLLLLNPAGALAAYFLAVPVMVILTSVQPRLSWVNPFTLVSELVAPNDSTAPLAGVVSLALWIGLLVAAALRIRRMDIE